MAQDCYKLFKTTYAQAVTDGLPVAAAQLAAQNAQQDCLNKQARQVTTVNPIVVVPATKTATLPDRGSILGTREK
jgi:hypothetical protein